MSRAAFWLALAVSALTIALGIRFSTFVAWGTDQAAYVEAARRWADGRPIRPSPIQFWSPWAPDDRVSAAFGFRHGAVRGTEVSEYPLGLPIIMAAAIRIAGPLAAYVVPPLCAGLLVWSAYLVGSALAGPWAGLIAGALLASSPITLAFAVQPMSDVPAAALWGLAWAMCLRPGIAAHAAAGAAVAAAIMIRPNQAPFAAILAILVWVSSEIGAQGHERTRWPRIVAFSSLAAIGPALIVWSQSALYGTPFRPGYVAAEGFYRLAHVRANLTFYPSLLVQLHTPLILTGLIASAALLVPRVRARLHRRAQAVALTAVAFVLMNYALYLPYLPMSDLLSIRFMLPALMALCVLLAGLTVHAARALGSVSPWLAVLALLPALIAGTNPAAAWPFVTSMRDDQAKARSAGRYLREALPGNAAVLARVHGTAIAHYTDRLIVRLDPIAPGALDAIVSELQRRGYRPVFVLDGGEERTWFRAHFASSQFHALEWPARAEFTDRVGTILYFDPTDREAHHRGHRWPTDVLRAP